MVNSPKNINKIWWLTPLVNSDWINTSINTIIESWDQFLKERPLQPKRAMQEYVASHGMKTPKRYNSLLEAVNSWKKFIIRSEHPQEYDGVSWLSDSIVVNPKDIINYQSQKSVEELEKLTFTKKEIQSWRTEDWEIIDAIKRYNFKKDTIRRIWFLSEEDILETLKLFSDWAFESYAKKMQLDKETVKNEQSYTFYEYIEGINHSVIADKDINGRYYIISNSSELEWWDYVTYTDWLIIQDGEIINEAGGFFAGEERDQCKSIEDRRIFDYMKLIEEYNKVRQLWKFDANHCPVMEFQTALDNSSPFFLQYHRLRDKTQIEKNSFTLDRELEEWEFESTFFRWITRPEWVIVETWSYYKWFNLVWCTTKEWREKISKKKGRSQELVNKYIEEWEHPIENEDASFDLHYDRIFSEIMSKRRLVNFGTLFDSKDPFWSEVMKLCSWHLDISKQFKSDLYVTLTKEQEKGLYDYRKIYELSNVFKAPYRVKIRVISDGKTCYIKPITTQEEVDADYQKYVWENK